MRLQSLLVLLATFPFSLASPNSGVDFNDGERPISWFKGGNTHRLSDEGGYYKTAMCNQIPSSPSSPVIEALSPQTSLMRNGNRSNETSLGKRMIAEDNPICQVFFWDGRQGGCTFLTGSLATGICRMKADRIGPFEAKDGDCMEVVVGHRNDDVSGVWGGCELRRAWKIEGECRTT